METSPARASFEGCSVFKIIEPITLPKALGVKWLRGNYAASFIASSKACALIAAPWPNQAESRR